MAQFEMIMPKMGESVAEATIIKWLKAEGDKIEADESVLEIATDKVDSEVPAPNGGTLLKRMFQEGNVVKVGAVIALISNDTSVEVAIPKEIQKASPAASNSAATSIITPALSPTTPQDFSGSTRFYSPLVKNIAKEE